jgi:fumarate reductase subunit D
MWNWEDWVVVPFQEMVSKIAGFVPSLVGALVILIIGLIIAVVIRGAVYRLLQTIRFDSLSRKAGIAAALERGGVNFTAAQLLSSLVFWLAVVVVLVMVVNALGLSMATLLLERIFLYIPKVISAVFILVLGIFLGTFVASTVKAAAQNANLPEPGLLSGITRWSIYIFATTISLGELGIAPLLLATTFNIFFAAVCFGMALAFGLGGKEIAARYLEELRQRHTRRNKGFVDRIKEKLS